MFKLLFLTSFKKYNTDINIFKIIRTNILMVERIFKKMKSMETKFKKAIELLEKTNATLSEGAKLSGLNYRDFYEKVIESKVLSKTEINKREIDVKEIDDVLKKIKV